MIGILIIAHGNLGDALVACATHVLGAPPHLLTCLSVEPHHTPAQTLQRAQTAIDQLNTGEGVLILSDIYGATPCNVVTQVLQTGQVQAVAGLNLPMLVRVLNYRHQTLAAVVQEALTGGREGVVHFNAENCAYYKDA
jgi:PTS system ascorbate-specific IIA component